MLRLTDNGEYVTVCNERQCLSPFMLMQAKIVALSNKNLSQPIFISVKAPCALAQDAIIVIESCFLYTAKRCSDLCNCLSNYFHTASCKMKFVVFFIQMLHSVSSIITNFFNWSRSCPIYLKTNRMKNLIKAKAMLNHTFLNFLNHLLPHM